MPSGNPLTHAGAKFIWRYNPETGRLEHTAANAPSAPLRQNPSTVGLLNSPAFRTSPELFTPSKHKTLTPGATVPGATVPGATVPGGATVVPGATVPRQGLLPSDGPDDDPDEDPSDSFTGSGVFQGSAKDFLLGPVSNVLAVINPAMGVPMTGAKLIASFLRRDDGDDAAPAPTPAPAAPALTTSFAGDPGEPFIQAEDSEDPEEEDPRAATGAPTDLLADTSFGQAESSGDDDDSGEDRVICTQLYRMGLISRTDWLRDLAFTYKHLGPVHVRGYHLWAVPVVRAMRRGRWVRVWRFLAQHRANEIAYCMDARSRPDYVGKLIRMIMEPFCYALGLLPLCREWRALYEEQKHDRPERVR